jgi:hypothetical protein
MQPVSQEADGEGRGVYASTQLDARKRKGHGARPGNPNFEVVGATVDGAVPAGATERHPAEEDGTVGNRHVDRRGVGAGMNEAHLGLAGPRSVVDENEGLDVGQEAGGGDGVERVRTQGHGGVDDDRLGLARRGHRDAHVAGGDRKVAGRVEVGGAGHCILSVDGHVDGGGVGGEVDHAHLGDAHVTRIRAGDVVVVVVAAGGEERNGEDGQESTGAAE